MSLRGLVLHVHLWLSLVLGVVILIVCSSGAALVYRHDIDRALHPAPYQVTPGDDVKVWLRSSGDIRPNVGSWHAWIDRTTGAVTAAMLPANTSVAAHANETWIIAIHYGTYGGEIVRLVYFAGGLVPVVLFFTGVIHWWVRRRRPQRASELSGEEFSRRTIG